MTFPYQLLTSEPGLEIDVRRFGIGDSQPGIEDIIYYRDDPIAKIVFVTEQNDVFTLTMDRKIGYTLVGDIFYIGRL